MKNLANCKPSEFLQQTNKIRKSVSKWLTDTDIINIRKRMPEIDENASDDERRDILNNQATKNVNAIFDAILEEHPTETLELLGLMCFVEPEDVDNYQVSEYIESFNEIISDTAVLSFFTSLVKLANQIT